MYSSMILCLTAAESWSAIQGREETGTEAFWWCNWQQMQRKMEIKKKEFKIISAWACIGWLSSAQRDHVLTFGLTASLLFKCFHYTVMWALRIWHFSATAAVLLWRKTAAPLEEESNKNVAIPTWSEHTQGQYRKQIGYANVEDILWAACKQYYQHHSHFGSSNISWEEDF